MIRRLCLRLASFLAASAIFCSTALVAHAGATDRYRGRTTIEPGELVVEAGKAPGLRVKKISGSDATAVFVLDFRPGDDVLSGIDAVARAFGITSGSISAVGALERATLAWYDTSNRRYEITAIDQGAEVASLSGNLSFSRVENKPVVHSHIVLSFKDGQTRGGHLVEGLVGPGLELTLTATSQPLYRHTDPQTGSGALEIP